MPSFNCDTGKPCFDENTDTNENKYAREIVCIYAFFFIKLIEYYVQIHFLLFQYNVEMDIIFRFSPFKTQEEIFQQFELIGGKGTQLIIFNMLLHDNGQPYLKIDRLKNDILITNEINEELEDLDLYIILLIYLVKKCFNHS